jgi:MFS family permease
MTTMQTEETASRIQEQEQRDKTHRASQTRKATASGWIGSALEYYDFFIYATAAALVFPQIFFPKGNPTVAIVASLATYGVGYVARPVGAFFLGHWGDTKGRKSMLLLCMFMMGISTMAVGLLPTYQQVGLLAPALLVILRCVQGFAVAGEITGASSMILEHAPFGRRGYYASFALQGVQAGQLIAAAIFIPITKFLPDDAFMAWGWRIPFLLSAFVLLAGVIIRRKVEETPVFTKEAKSGTIAKAPILEAFQSSWKNMLIVACVALTNVIAVVTAIFGAAYACQPSYGIGMSKSIFLWIPVAGNIMAVCIIPFVGNLADKIGRKPLVAFGALGSGALAFPYLYFISVRNIPMAFVISVLMWGTVYQGFNAIFPSFYPELFPPRIRVSGMAIAQNFGQFLSAMLPAVFVWVAPPHSLNIPLKVGGVSFVVCAVAAVATLCARENYRMRVEDLGNPSAVPVPKDEYNKLRLKSIAG